MEEQKTKKAPAGLIAVVEKFAGPGENRPVEFVQAATKREMKQKLSDPGIATVLGLMRGRKLEFRENRNVNF
jgi:hypothetical protein